MALERTPEVAGLGVGWTKPKAYFSPITILAALRGGCLPLVGHPTKPATSREYIVILYYTTPSISHFPILVNICALSQTTHPQLYTAPGAP